MRRIVVGEALHGAINMLIEAIMVAFAGIFTGATVGVRLIPPAVRLLKYKVVGEESFLQLLDKKTITTIRLRKLKLRNNKLFILLIWLLPAFF
jgi:hypothetical protein